MSQARPGQRSPAVYMSQSRVTEVVNALTVGGISSGVDRSAVRLRPSGRSVRPYVYSSPRLRRTSSIAADRVFLNCRGAVIPAVVPAIWDLGAALLE